MINNCYRIGELSKATGVSKDTLHFYDRIKLLVPDYVDKENGYRYYSLKNLWQLDIIVTCRKLDIPLETIREILSKDNNKDVVDLLMRHREKAIELSRYYQQVADDISWYWQENEHIAEVRGSFEIQEVELEEEIVLGGFLNKSDSSYHLMLQEAAQEQLRKTSTIKRRYGYILSNDGVRQGKVIKEREYLKFDSDDSIFASEKNLMKIPSGRYAVFRIEINNETADFTPFLNWMERNNKKAVQIYAEEVGLQLFQYINHYYCDIKVLLSD